MGYFQPLTQFSQGEYQGATQTQDDFAIIAGYLGPPSALPELHGNSMSTATPLTPTIAGTTAAATAIGIIKEPSKVEMFSFTAAASMATVQVLGVPAFVYARTNLNVALTIYASNGTIIAATSGVGIPATAVSLPLQGTYYVALGAAGSGDPLTTGYPAYGSRCGGW